MNVEIVQVDPRHLKNYPLNQKIYGDHIDENYLKQVEKDGRIKEPLTVCRSSLPNLDGHIVKGRRRRMAAIMKRFETVPVIYWDCEDVLEFEYELITDNIRNDVTMEEKVRMYEELKRIEAERAKVRQLSGKAVNTSQVALNSTQPQKRAPTASEFAAKKVGMKRNTAERAAKVVDEIDTAERVGQKEKAQILRETLNNKSVNAAVRLVDRPKKSPIKRDNGELPESDIPERLKPIFALIEQFKAFDKVWCPRTQDLAQLAAIAIFGEKVANGPNSPLDYKLVGALMGKIYKIIMPWQPDRVCDCGGDDKSCKKCKGRGWLPKVGMQR